MKTAKEIAQWVIDNRYPKSEYNKVSDFEMYHEIATQINEIKKHPDLESVEFFDLMQAYRMAPAYDQEKVVISFERIKDWLKK